MAEQLESMDRSGALAFLYDRIDYERRSAPLHNSFRLERMTALMAMLGNPQHQLPAIHVAGTKGKGSTAAMVHQVGQAAGYRVGLYTSPHLQRLEERFVVDGQLCSATELVALIQQLRPLIETLDSQSGPDDKLTFFEITTALAFLHFRQQNVDFAVLEVGIGGRLDSTNVCQSEVSVITNIGLDHTHLLGSTIEKIASEKAGIIKPGVPVVSGAHDAAAAEVIAAVAERQHAPLAVIQRDFHYQLKGTGEICEQFDFSATIDGRCIQWKDLESGIPGRHQVDNASVALAALAQLNDRWPVSETAVRRGLASAHCPARLELIPGQPRVLLDVAHNLPSIQALAQHLETRLTAERRLLVFACSRDKDVQQMLPHLLPRFDEVLLTRFVDNPRARDPLELLQLARGWLANHPAKDFRDRQPRLHIADQPLLAWQRARQLAGADDLICVAGSFFLAAEIRQLVPDSPGIHVPSQ
jgi:dihydrofolate synthase/folylpolyglutamate synthase